MNAVNKDFRAVRMSITPMILIKGRKNGAKNKRTSQEYSAVLSALPSDGRYWLTDSLIFRRIADPDALNSYCLKSLYNLWNNLGLIFSGSLIDHGNGLRD